MHISSSSFSTSLHQVPVSSQIKLSSNPSTTTTTTRRRTDDGVVVASLPLPSHVTSITSPSNPFVKHCVKLRQSSSYRHSHASTLVIGTTPIREITRFQEVIEEKPAILDCLLLLDGVEVPEGLYDSSIRIVRVSSMVMKKLSGVQSIDSIEAIALMRIPNSVCSVDDNQREVNFRNWFPLPHRILVLDGIQDPGNLGTLLRSGIAFGWDGVFLLPGCCDPFNEKALRAARGACFQIPIVSGNWIHLETLRSEFQMKMLAGHPESNGNSSALSRRFIDTLADKHVCLVLGSEGNGLSKQSKQACELISIPMAGAFDSLNVSVADDNSLLRERIRERNRLYQRRRRARMTEEQRERERERRRQYMHSRRVQPINYEMEIPIPISYQIPNECDQVPQCGHQLRESQVIEMEKNHIMGEAGEAL